jgi:flagellar hook-length control protein FliK
MNLSTFFFDKLSRTDSNLAQEGKKSIDANYLFSDLIKVYEVNNESSQDLKTFSSDIPQEIFSDDEKIINLTANDFASVDNLIQRILTNDANIDDSKTDYNFPEAEITKEKFIVDKEKLLSILAIFFQNQNIKSTDLVKEKIENGDNLSITFKNKLDKISVSISPIKVEPQIDSEEKPNDFLFASKILVDSLLPETQNEQSSDGKVRKLEVKKSVEKKDEPIDSKLIQTGSDEHITNTFYKVELIKIYDKQKYIPSIDSNDADSFLQKELNFKFVDEVVTKPIKDSLKIELNNSDNLKQEEVIIQKINNESLENVSESNNSLSLKDIYDDLTDEEKSVFRKFEESNEIKKVVYSSNKIEKEKVADFVKTKTITENKDATQGIEIPKAETKVAFDKKTTINSEQKVATEEIQEFDEVNDNLKLKVENQNGKGNKLDGINLSTDEKINSDKVEIKVNFSQSKQQADKIGQEKPKIETVQLKNNVVEEKDNNAKPSITSKENNSITKEQTSKENNSVNQFEELTSVSEKVLVKVSTSPNIKVVKSIETETDNRIINTKDFEVKENYSGKFNQHKTEVETIIANENNPSIKAESKQAENSSIDKKVEIKTAESKIQVADEKQNSTSDKHYSENKNNFESSKNNFAKNDFSQLNISGNMDFEKLKLPVEQKSFFESTKPLTQNEIIPEFSKFIQLGEKQSISFQLTPENLGKVNLIVDLVDNVVTTKIEVENEQVKQFIQSNLDQLKNNLQSNGIQLSNINISLADYSQKQNGKVVAEKKKYNSKISREEEKVEEVNLHKATKKMGYNTYEFLA